MSTINLIEMEQALEALGANVDPAKEGAEDLTYQIADALTATAAALRPFNKVRQLSQAQHKLRDGEPPSLELIEVLDRAASQEVDVELPDTPLDRGVVFRCLRVPIPGVLARLGPMLAPAQRLAPVAQ